MALKEVIYAKVAEEIGRSVEDIDCSKLQLEVAQTSSGDYYEYSNLVVEVDGLVKFGNDEEKYVSFSFPYNQVSDFITEALSALLTK